MTKVIETAIISRTGIKYKTKKQIIKEAELPQYFAKLPLYFAELEIMKVRTGRFSTRGFPTITEKEFTRRKEKAKKAHLKEIRGKKR
jgi:hypothetical protein